MAMEKPRGSVRFDGPNMDVLVDLGHPLLNRVVDGFIKVDGIGALNAASQDAYKLVLQEEANKASFRNMKETGRVLEDGHYLWKIAPIPGV